MSYWQIGNGRWSVSKWCLDFLPEDMMIALYKIGNILISGMREKKTLCDGNVEIGWTTCHPSWQFIMGIWKFETGT